MGITENIMIMNKLELSSSFGLTRFTSRIVNVSDITPGMLLVLSKDSIASNNTALERSVPTN